MRLNRFFGNFSAGGGSAFGGNFSDQVIKSSDKDLINQLKNVLRLNNGDEIILCDGKLNEASCVIESIGRNEAVFKVVKVWQNKKEFSSDIILYCSVLKRENFELVVQKAVELGVKEIVPIIAKRTVKLGLREDRVQKIIKEAAEQSGRGILPILRQETPFEDAVGEAEVNDLNLFFSPFERSAEGREPDKKFLAGTNIDPSKYKKIGVFIGPEGGWAETELQAVSSKFQVVGLSPFTLRAETAAIAALAVIQQFL